MSSSFHDHVCDEILVNPEYGISAEVELIVDTTNTDDVEASIEAFESNMDTDWSVRAESVFITASPTVAPSKIPSIAPTTLQPSVQPSITGLVVTIDVTSFSLVHS